MRLAMRLFPSSLMHMDVLHSAPLNAKMSASFLLPYLEYFSCGGSIETFMENEKVWGEDLTAYKEFAQKVLMNVKRIENGESLI